MVSKLEKAGFEVTRIPILELTGEKLAIWLKDAAEIWGDLIEE